MGHLVVGLEETRRGLSGVRTRLGFGGQQEHFRDQVEYPEGASVPETQG